MSLFEVERLVHRLGDYLEPSAQTATLPKDAQDYSSWVNKANQRMDQVVFMMDQDDMHQAMQLERVDPCLTDLVGLLDFAKSKKFRELCVKQGLAEPPKIKRQNVLRLNDLYGADLDTLDELWREYNGARLQQDFDAAINVIRRIIRAKPDDKNAQQELHEMERVSFSERFQSIEDAVAAQDYQTVMSLIGVQEPLLEQFGLDQRTSPIWVQAKEMELQVWMSWLVQFRQSNDWQSSLSWISRIRDSAGKSGLILSGSDSQTIAQTEQWANQMMAEVQEESAFNQHYVQLQEILGQASMPNRQVNVMTKEQCEAELNDLSHAMQNATQYSQACTQRITQEVHDNFMIRSRNLDERIGDLESGKKKIIAAVCVLGILCLSVGIIFYTLANNKKQWVQNVETGMATNLCLTVSNLIVEAETDYGTNDIPGALSKTYMEAKQWLAKKNTDKELLRQDLKEQQSVTNGIELAELEPLATNIESLSNRIAACCMDEQIQTELNQSLRVLDRVLVENINSEKINGEGLIKSALVDFEGFKRELEYEPLKLHKALLGIEKQYASCGDYVSNPVVGIAPRMVSAFQSSEAELEELMKALEVHLSHLNKLGLVPAGPDNLDKVPVPDLNVTDFLGSLKSMADSGFLNEQDTSEANKVLQAMPQGFEKQIAIALFFDGETEMENAISTTSVFLNPLGVLPLAEQKFFYSSIKKSEFYSLMVSTAAPVTHVFKDKFNRAVQPPQEPHLIMRKDDGNVLYLNSKLIPVPGKEPVNAAEKFLLEQYKYLDEVLEYRQFLTDIDSDKEFFELGATGWTLKRPIWWYLKELQKRIQNKRVNDKIALYQQFEIIKYVTSLPMERQYFYGIPSKAYSTDLKSKLDNLDLGIDEKSWFLNKGNLQVSDSARTLLAAILKDTEGFQAYREIMVKGLDSKFEFVGFYNRGPKFFSESNDIGKVIIINKAGNFVNLDAQLLGTSSVDDDQNPLLFSPIFKYSVNSGKTKDELSKLDQDYSYFKHLPSVYRLNKESNE